MIPNKEQAFELLKMKLLYASMSRSAPSRPASRPAVLYDGDTVLGGGQIT